MHVKDTEMAEGGLREGLEEGVGRVQDGLDSVFAGDWIGTLKSRGCKTLCGTRDAVSDLAVDRPILSVTIAVLIGLVLGRRLSRRG